MIKKIALFLLLTSVSSVLTAGQLRVAVAANFKTTLQKIANKFEQQTQHEIVIISGSSGTLFSQIFHGAPYDVFLSADSFRPKKLIRNNLAFEDSLFTYAIGQLAFWSPNHTITNLETIKNLIQHQKGKLAIANPRLAPYGHSSLEFLNKTDLLTVAKNKLITGNNVVQTFQFVDSGNAISGIVSYSQLIHSGISDHFLLLPSALYPQIKQQGVILKNSHQLKLAKQFISFLNNQNKTLILNEGYLVEANNVG